MADTLSRSFRAGPLLTNFPGATRFAALSACPGYYIPAPLALKSQTLPQLQLILLPTEFTFSSPSRLEHCCFFYCLTTRKTLDI